MCSALTAQQTLSDAGSELTNDDDDDNSSSSVLDVFQVYKPPAAPLKTEYPCSTLLMQHVFAFSYGQPFVGNYTPPACSFNTVTINLTVSSHGRQFDRLALLYLGDIEVFRTSTAEPTPAGIVWTYTKDMTQYLPLWKQPQKVIFDLGNLIDSTYTGAFNVTLTASFFTSPNPPLIADVILPISARNSAQNGASAFTLPSDNATTTLMLPGGVQHATVSLSACGQATEEFWYSNVLSTDTETFLNTTGELYGYSPFREVQLLIDGMVAGVVWPFPIIFTGGIAPGFWRPIVGIDAFDLRESEIDISPFVPYLSDGKPHSFQIKVVGLQSNGNGALELSEEVGSYWVVTGKVFLFIDGDHSARNMPPDRGQAGPRIQAVSEVTQNGDGVNETLSYSVSVTRNVWIQSDGNYWYQTLEYRNDGLLTSGGLTQVNTQNTVGVAALYHAPRGPRVPSLRTQTKFQYPITVNTTYGIFPNNSGISIDATLNRGLNFFSEGRPDISTFSLVSGPGALETTQYGSASYSSQTNAPYSAGDTKQDFWQGSSSSQYGRDVEAVNGSVVRDSLGARNIAGRTFVDLGVEDIRSILGRGPGRPAVPFA